MVKSKKMSKSTVAIVLLSLLLVLSLILTATGAWFTFTAKNDANDAGSYNFRDNAMSATIGDMSEGYGNLMREGVEVTDHNDVMPGDTIKGGSIEVTFTVAGDAGAYMVYRVGDGTWKLLSGDDASATNLTKVTSTSKFTLKADDYEIDGPTTLNDKQGQPVEGVDALKLGAIEVRMCQAENISMADAYALLTASTFQANKA